MRLSSLRAHMFTPIPHPAPGRPPSRLCGRDSFPPPPSRVPVPGRVPEAGSPRPALQPRPPSDGGVRLQETALLQLRAPTSSTRRDRPADSTSPPGGPQRPSQQARPRSEPQTPLYGRGGQDGHSRKGPQRPWGPWQGQQWRASGIPEPEKWAARAPRAMTSVWKRLQRVGKRAAKFQFVACYHELVLECTKKW